MEKTMTEFASLAEKRRFLNLHKEKIKQLLKDKGARSFQQLKEKLPKLSNIQLLMLLKELDKENYIIYSEHYYRYIR